MGRPRKATPADDDELVEPTTPDDYTTEVLEQMEDVPEREPLARVQREDPETGKLKLVGRFPPDQVTEEFIMRKFGGGRYIVQVYGIRKSDGKFGYVKGRGARKEIIIDEAIYPFKGGQGLRGDVRDGPPPEDEDTKFLVKNQLMEMMRDQAEARQHTASMMMTMMKMMADSTAAQTQAMAAMVSSLRSDKSGLADVMPVLVAALNGRGDPLDLAAKLVALTKQGETAGGLNGIETVLSLAERLAQRLNGTPDEPDADTQWINVVKEMGPEALRLLRSVVERRVPADVEPGIPPRRAVAPTPNPALGAVPSPAPAPSSAPAMPTDEWTPIEGVIRQHLLPLATRGVPAHRVAGLVLALATDEQVATLRELVAHDDIADIFVARFPEFQARRVWLDDFIGALADELLGDDIASEDEEQPEPPTPDKEPAHEPPAARKRQPRAQMD
jgi:hypothetical protein